uniref:Uncharacterized protein n=1 Tax=viral metagenome TaxID=1070528 RepID=A0A6M3JN53_9ZZZZ
MKKKTLLKQFDKEFGKIKDKDGYVINISILKFILTLLKTEQKKIIEYLSHDMNFKNEKQRKEAIKMYIENLLL